MTLQFFQSADSSGTRVAVAVRAGTAEAGDAGTTVGWERVGTSVVGTTTVGVVTGLAEHAASKAVTNKGKKKLNLIRLFACGLNGFCDLAGQHGFPFGGEMKATVGKLLHGDEIPEIKIIPVMFRAVRKE